MFETKEEKELKRRAALTQDERDAEDKAAADADAAKRADEEAAAKAKADAEDNARLEAERDASKPSRAAFKALIDAYKKSNPVKYELKKVELERKLAAL